MVTRLRLLLVVMLLGLSLHAQALDSFKAFASKSSATLRRTASETKLDTLKDGIDSAVSSSPLLSSMSKLGDKGISYGDLQGCARITDSSELAGKCKSASGEEVACVSGKKCCSTLGDKGHGCVFLTFSEEPDQVFVTAGVDTKKYGVFQVLVMQKTPEELLETIANMVEEPICVQPLGLWGAALAGSGRVLEATGLVEHNRVGKTEVCIQFIYDQRTANAERMGTITAFLSLRGNCLVPDDDAPHRPFQQCRLNCKCSRKAFGNPYPYECSDCEDSWNCAKTINTAPVDDGSMSAKLQNTLAAKQCAVCKGCSGCRKGACSRCLGCENCDHCELEKAKHAELCTLFQCSGPHQYDLPRSVFKAAIKE